MKIIVPESFNFAFDVVDFYAKEDPEKRALVWCNDRGDELVVTGVADPPRLQAMRGDGRPHVWLQTNPPTT